MLAGSVAVFRLWQVIFKYPANSGLALAGEIEIPTSWLESYSDIILGSLGLSTLISFANWRGLIRHFYAPFREVKSDDLRDFYSSVGVFLFSIASLAFFLWSCLGNISLTVNLVNKGDEVLIHSASSRSFFLLPDEEANESVRTRPVSSTETLLSSEVPARLFLQGFKNRTVLIVRDKFNLLTLDALIVNRSPLGFELNGARFDFSWASGLDELELSRLASDWTEKEEARKAHRDSLSERDRLYTPLGIDKGLISIRIRGPLRFNRSFVNLVRDRSGRMWGNREGRRLIYEPGDGTGCPGKAPSASPGRAEIQRFWDTLCSERDDLREWTAVPFTRDGRARTVAHAIPGYLLEILFNDGFVRSIEPRLLLQTREAGRVLALRSDGIVECYSALAACEEGVRIPQVPVADSTE